MVVHGPKTELVLKKYSKLFKSKHIIRAKIEVNQGVEVQQALTNNKLPNGKFPCTPQYLNRWKKNNASRWKKNNTSLADLRALDDATVKNNGKNTKKKQLNLPKEWVFPTPLGGCEPVCIREWTDEESRRQQARELILSQYHQLSEKGCVGQGKKYGMQQIKESVEKDILKPTDKKLVLRTLLDHAAKDLVHQPKRGRPIKKLEDKKLEDKKIIDMGKCVWVLSNKLRNSLTPTTTLEWHPGRVWNNKKEGDSMTLYDIVHDEGQQEEEVPSVFIAERKGEKGETPPSLFDFEEYNIYMDTCQVRKEEYGNENAYVKKIEREKNGIVKILQDNSHK